MRFPFLVLFSLALLAPARAESMKYPLSAALAPDGTTFVADRKLPGVWKVDDGKPTLYFQGSNKFRTPMNAIRCLAVDGKGRLLAGDSATRQIYRFDESGKPTPILTNKIGIGIPMDIAVDSTGTIFVVDLELKRIWKVPAEGGEPEEVAAIDAVRALTIDSKDNIWVLTNAQSQLLRLDKEGKPTPILKERVFQYPNDLVVTDDGTAYITDGYAKAVWKVSTGEVPKKLVAGEPLVNPVGIARQGEHLLVVDSRANQLFQVTLDGKVTPIVTEK